MKRILLPCCTKGSARTWISPMMSASQGSPGCFPAAVAGYACGSEGAGARRAAYAGSAMRRNVWLADDSGRREDWPESL